MGRDFRNGLRRLARRPGFTVAAAGILALGLSTSTAVFTYVNAYGRPMPGAGAENLHQVWFATEESPWASISILDFRDLVQRGEGQFFVAAIGGGSFAATVRRDQEAEIAFRVNQWTIPLRNLWRPTPRSREETYPRGGPT